MIANAWYTSHLWQHYLYTLDEDFLREKALPVMVSCCKFWMQRLKEASDGSLVAPTNGRPSMVPPRRTAQPMPSSLWPNSLSRPSQLST